MSRNVGEILKDLITTEDYIDARSKVSDEFIAMVKDCMISSYDLISEKEEAYQEIISMIKEQSK